MEKWDIDFSFFLYIAILLFCVPFNWLGAIVTAVIVHEACHVAAVYVSGTEIKKVRIGIHGISMLADGLSPWQAAISTLAGPAGSFFLMICSRIFPRLAICGFIHGIFNLLPIYPLDGGKLLRIIMNVTFQRDKAKHICEIVSNVAYFIVTLGSLFALLKFKIGFFPVAAALWLLFQKIPCKDSKLRVQ